ncbi:unnamed protein product [Rotaria magnacalcarata]|uniref:Endonuclease/exonuclease/phosphatase domain-containing protein n=1 Tax=Rotaria magnacalcarata TaxID=392030 RepID=A0A8S3GI85_9BILA|nr:unnamed protein product [Rotaria magnacalcarata]
MIKDSCNNLNYKYEHKLNCFLDQTRNTLVPKDFSLLTEVITEWHAASSFNELLIQWKRHHKSFQQQSSNYIHLLCFNVRGLELRWGEVCLLVEKHHSDILVLGEVGHIDFSLVGAAFSNYGVYYQAGENSHGGVLVLIRKDMTVTRISCALPNVYVIDIHLREPIRIIALYAPASKSWNWTDITSFITEYGLKCP